MAEKQTREQQRQQKRTKQPKSFEQEGFADRSEIYAELGDQKN